MKIKSVFPRLGSIYQVIRDYYQSVFPEYRIQVGQESRLYTPDDKVILLTLLTSPTIARDGYHYDESGEEMMLTSLGYMTITANVISQTANTDSHLIAALWESTDCINYIMNNMKRVPWGYRGVCPSNATDAVNKTVVSSEGNYLDYWGCDLKMTVLFCIMTESLTAKELDVRTFNAEDAQHLQAMIEEVQ